MCRVLEGGQLEVNVLAMERLDPEAYSQDLEDAISWNLNELDSSPDLADHSNIYVGYTQFCTVWLGLCWIFICTLDS